MFFWILEQRLGEFICSAYGVGRDSWNVLLIICLDAHICLLCVCRVLYSKDIFAACPELLTDLQCFQIPENAQLAWYWQTFLITCYKGPKKDKEWQRCIQNKWNSAVLGCSFHKSHLDKQESRRTTFQSRGRAVPGRTPPALLAFRSAHGLTFCLGFRKCPGTIDTILW